VDEGGRGHLAVEGHFAESHGGITTNALNLGKIVVGITSEVTVMVNGNYSAGWLHLTDSQNQDTRSFVKKAQINICFNLKSISWIKDKDNCRN
jgi:hypothetical protein